MLESEGRTSRIVTSILPHPRSKSRWAMESPVMPPPRTSADTAFRFPAIVEHTADASGTAAGREVSGEQQLYSNALGRHMPMVSNGSTVPTNLVERKRRGVE